MRRVQSHEHTPAILYAREFRIRIHIPHVFQTLAVFFMNRRLLSSGMVKMQVRNLMTSRERLPLITYCVNGFLNRSGKQGAQDSGFSLCFTTAPECDKLKKTGTEAGSRQYPAGNGRNQTEGMTDEKNTGCDRYAE